MPTRGISMRHRQTSATRARAVLAALSALGLLLAGCSGSGEGDAAPTSTGTPRTTAETSPEPEPTPTTFEEVQAVYEACLRDQGSEPGLLPTDVDLTEVAGMVGATDEELTALGTTRDAVVAHAACWPAFLESLETVPLPEAQGGDSAEPAPPADPELAAKLREAVACLNERGWDFLEPGVETGELTMAARDPAFDWDDEAFLADQRECQQLAGMMG